MNPTIERLKELRAKATTKDYFIGENERIADKESYPVIFVKLDSGNNHASVLWEADWAVKADADYIVALHNSLPELLAYIETLEKRAEAGKRLAGVVGFAARMPDHGDCRMNINLALAAYNQSVKE